MDHHCKVVVCYGKLPLHEWRSVEEKFKDQIIRYLEAIRVKVIDYSSINEEYAQMELILPDNKMNVVHELIQEFQDKDIWFQLQTNNNFS